MWLERRPVLSLLIISLVVHACVLAGVRMRTGRATGYAFSSLDAGEYYELARNIADHGVFSRDAAAPLKPDTWRTPGYPLFLALAMSIVGKAPIALITAQQLLSIVNVLILFRVFRTNLGDRRAGIAALLFLFEPYHLFYSTWLMSTTLFVTCLLMCWYAWERVVERRSWIWFGCLGVFSSFLVLVRPVGILVPVVMLIGVGLMMCSWQRNTRTRLNTHGRWLCGIVFAVALLIPCGAWMVRNQIVARHFALSDQSGVVLAYFKATEVVLWRQGRASDRYVETSLDDRKAHLPHTVWEGIDTRLRDGISGVSADQRDSLIWQNLAQGNKTTVDSFEISHALSRIGRSLLAQSPVDTAVCCLVRCGSILTFPLNLAFRPALGTEAGRLRNVLISLPYLLLCVAVVMRLVQRWPAYGAVYFPLMCTAALLLVSTPQLDPRFRVPMIPMLIFIALAPAGHSARSESPLSPGRSSSSPSSG